MSSLRSRTTQLEWTEVESRLRAFLAGCPTSVYVRPSLPGETIAWRGHTDSIAVVPEPEAVAEVVIRLWSKWSDHDPLGCGVIVQQTAASSLKGHLSNERWLTANPDRWTVEIEAALHQGEPATNAFRVECTQRAQPRDSAPLLVGRNFDALLHLVAEWACPAEHRWHFEWVFDGEGLYIVQADAERPVKALDGPGSYWLSRSIPPAPTLRAPLRNIVPDDGGRWPKVRSQLLFAALEAPTTQLYLLDDPSAWSTLGTGTIPAQLREALRSLFAWPLVGRTDIATESMEHGLPISGNLMTPADAEEFLLEVARNPRLVQSSRPCVLFHRFIPAASGAWALASPGGSSVRVDVTYGVPDSLSAHSHDTFEIRGGQIASRGVRFKDGFINVEEGGEWRERPTGAPWDWRPSASDDELLEVGRLTQRIAEELEKPTQVMYFLSVPVEVAPKRVLPWVHEHPPETPQPEYGLDPRGWRRVPLVRTGEQLEELVRLPESERPTRVRFRPPVERVRDKQLAERVGKLAAANKITLVFEGSRLAHCGYALQRVGARVVQPEPITESAHEAQVYNKLVRDGIPAKIIRGGEVPVTRRVSGESLVRLLIQKLLEEAFEVRGAETRTSLVEELADVLEVIDGILEAAQLTREEVTGAAETKKAKRGGFSGGTLLLSTAEPRGVVDAPDLGISGGQQTDIAPSEALEITDQRPRLAKDGSLVVPLIPPHAWPAVPRNRLRLPAVDRVLLIEYGAKEMTLRFERHAPTARTQEELPLNDSTSEAGPAPPG
jgi:predicted house-cleaning noncanonical NTP pyrophosphatase (MazG superfamily)